MDGRALVGAAGSGIRSHLGPLIMLGVLVLLRVIREERELRTPPVRGEGKGAGDGSDGPGTPPLVLIGYWRSDDEPGWPDPRLFIDPAWDRQERAMIVAHLRAGRVPWVRMERSSCLLCGSEQGSGERTDGTYLWPDILVHYLEEHDVRLPDVFVLHVRATRAGGDPGSRVGPPAPLDRETAMERADRAWWASTDLDVSG